MHHLNRDSLYRSLCLFSFMLFLPIQVSIASSSKPSTKASTSTSKRFTPSTRPTPSSQKTSTQKAKKNSQGRKTFELKILLMRRGKREVIEGAGVFILEKRRGDYTDEKGLVRFQLPNGSYTILAKPMGFIRQKRKLILDHSQAITFYLEPDPKNASQTITRAKREKKAVQQLTISRKDIRESAGGLGGDPIRALQNLPGVAKARGLSGGLRIRGASPSDTGFYLDGHPLPALYHFGGGPAIVNDRFIDKIDFFPGGAPVSYGRFSSGLVSVSSRDPSLLRWGGEFYVDLIHAGFFLEAPINKYFSVAAAARRSYVDAFAPLLTSDAFVARYWDYQLKAVFQARSHRLSLFIFGADDLVDYEAPEEGGSIPFVSTDKIYIWLFFHRALLSYRFAKGPVTITASLMTGFDRRLQEDKETNIRLDLLPLEIRTELQLQLHKKLRFVFGFDGAWHQYDYGYRLRVGEFLGFPKPSYRPLYLDGDGEQNVFVLGAYAQLRWNIIKPLLLQVGVRSDIYQQQERDTWGFEPRASLQATFSKKWSGFLSLGTFHRPPQVDRWVKEIGNPDLTLPGSLQATIGGSFQPFKQFNIRISLFWNSMYDRVVGSGKVLEKDGKKVRENYNNQGTGRGYGIEVLLKLRDWKGFSGWLAYTFSRSERGRVTSETMSLYSYDQPHILNLLLRYKIGRGWSASSRFRLVSGRPTTPVTGSTYDADTDSYRPIRGKSNSVRYPVFHQLDLRIDKEWKFNTWTLGVYLDIQNVYYSQITERYRYQFDYKKLSAIPSLPTIPAFGIRGEF